MPDPKPFRELLGSLGKRGSAQVEQRIRSLGEPSTYLRDMAHGKIDKDHLINMVGGLDNGLAKAEASAAGFVIRTKYGHFVAEDARGYPTEVGRPEMAKRYASRAQAAADANKTDMVVAHPYVQEDAFSPMHTKVDGLGIVRDAPTTAELLKQQIDGR